MTDIFILCVDRDGEIGRHHRLDQLNRYAVLQLNFWP